MTNPPDCPHCKNGWMGSDVECVNGILIDIDEFTEGYALDVWRRPAPCHPRRCTACAGTGEEDGGDCDTCEGSGYIGPSDYEERLLAASREQHNEEQTQ